MSIFFSTNIPEMRSILTFNRIGTNISTILQRLETGLRINSAKDDPSGLVAREIMRADIKGIQMAQRNNSMANGLLSAAEGGMANIAKLLYGNPSDKDDTGLLGLIYDDSYTAAEKREQVLDILNMIDGIANSTTYNGRTIINGSLDYHTSGVDSRQLSQLQVHRADVRGTDGVKASVDVKEKAEKGSLVLDQSRIGNKNVTLQLRSGTTNESTTVTLAAGSTAQEIVEAVNAVSGDSGVTARIETGLTRNEFVLGGAGADNDLVFTAKNGGNEYYKVVMWSGGAAATDIIMEETNPGNGTETSPYVFKIRYQDGATASDIVDYLNRSPGANDVLQKFQSVMTVRSATGQSGNGAVSNVDSMAVYGDPYSGSGMQLLGDSTKVESVEFILDSDHAADPLVPQGKISIAYADKKIQIRLASDGQGNVTSTARDVVDFLNRSDVMALDTGLGASLLRPEGQSYSDDTSFKPGHGLLSTGAPLTMNVFSGNGYTTMDTVSKGETKIVFETMEYGSDRVISVSDISAEPAVTIVNADGKAADTDYGKDAVVTVNGYAASASGNRISFSSDRLGFTTVLSDAVEPGESVGFRVTGGGATFQIGKDVVSDLQLKVGLPSVTTGALGGANGVLSTLRELDFANEQDKSRAYLIVNEAVASLANSRSRIGSIQKNVLDSNTETLDNQLTVVTESEALISNADTALESSRLAREELLAEAAMNSILYARAFARFSITSLF